MRNGYERLSEDCLYAIYQAYILKYQELYAIYELCDENFDQDIVESMDFELDALNEELIAIENALMDLGWVFTEVCDLIKKTLEIVED